MYNEILLVLYIQHVSMYIYHADIPVLNPVHNPNISATNTTIIVHNHGPDHEAYIKEAIGQTIQQTTQFFENFGQPPIPQHIEVQCNTQMFH